MKKFKTFLLVLFIFTFLLMVKNELAYAAQKTTGSAIEYFEVSVKDNTLDIGDVAHLSINVPTPGEGVVSAIVKLQWCSNIDNPGTKIMKDISGETSSTLSIKLDEEGKYAFTCKYTAQFVDFEGLKLYSGETKYEWITVGNPPNISDGGENQGGNTTNNKNNNSVDYAKYSKDKLNIININNSDWINKNFVVMSRKDGTENKIAPFSIFKDGMIKFISNENGDYVPIYNEKKYTDILSHWGKDGIEFVSARELFKGVSDNEFSPNTTMTKAMFVTVLSRLESDVISNNYSDNYFYEAVIWACDNNIATTDIRIFNPEANITREEMAAMLYNYTKYANLNIQDVETDINFNDFDNIYFKDAVTQLCKWGIFIGDENGNFNPHKTATRAEVATVIQRFIEATLK